MLHAGQGTGSLRRHTAVLLAAGLSTLASCAVPQTATAPIDDVKADNPPISPPPQDDADVSDSLEWRLAYAQSQAESQDGDCASRLQTVQRQRDIAAADPALDIVVPEGRARLANIDYRLHLGRASCGSEAKPRKDELLAALDAAQRAVPLYRAVYDYQAMAIMQYDVAAAYRLLGDTDKAVTALKTAIGMDSDYGFAADAQDNAETLRRWTGQAADPVQMAVSVPKRSITLAFAWEPRDADVALEADYLDLTGGAVVHSKAATSLTRHIRADDGDWIVSSEVADRHYDFGDWRDRGATSLVRTVLAQAAEQMWPPELRVGAKGDFKGVVEADKTTAALAGDIDEVSNDLHLEPEGEADLTSDFGRTLELLARPDGMQARVAEDYTLAISAWIDATMEQGVWYEMTASLMVPGMVVLVEHDIQFAYAGPVPCTRGAVEADCAEILVHAVPDPDDLQDKLDYVRQALRLRHPIRYEAATDLRLVVDPARLLPYVSEARRHWYLAIDGKGDPLVGAEKVVSTYIYR